MTDTPSTSGSHGGNTFKRCARASWLAPLLAITVHLLILAVGRPEAALKVQAVVGPSLILIGLGAGIIALAGTSKVGRRGILAPAVIGTIMNLCLIGLAAMPFLMKPRPTRLEPAVHASGARILNDEKLGLKLDIPAGFAEFPEGKALHRADHFFLKGNTNDTELDLLFLITALPGVLSKRILQTNDIPGLTNGTQRTFKWRGLEVNGIVVRENLLGTPFTTYNIQLPTVPRAVQISVAAPTARHAELEQITAALLPSIEAKSNW